MNTIKTYDRRVLLALTGVVVVLAANAYLSHQNMRRMHDAADSVARTHDVLDALADIRTEVSRAEAIQRSYLVTAEADLLSELNGALTNARQNVERVATLTTDDPDQYGRATDLASRAEVIEGRLRRTVVVRDTEGFDAARRVVQGGDFRRQIHGLRIVLDGMEQEEQRLLAKRTADSERAYTTALTTGLVAAFAGLVAVGMVVWLVQRHLAARTRATVVLAEQSERLRTTLASIGDAVITTDTVGRVTNLNPVAETLTGWTTAEAMGRPLTEVFNIVHEDSRQSVENPALRALKERAIVGLANHTVLIARDGTERPIDDNAAPIRDAAGKVFGCVLVFRDITEQKAAEEALRRQTAMLQAITDTTTDLVFVKDQNCHLTFANPATLAVMGLTEQQALSATASGLFSDPSEVSATLAADRRVMASGTSETIEEVYTGPHGTRTYLSTKTPLRDGAGVVIGVIGISQDITARKQAADILREREAELREAQRVARVGSWSWDAATDATTGSDELYRLYGLDPAEGPFPAFRQQNGTLYPPESWSRINEVVRWAVETGGSYELDVPAFRAGQPIWVTTRGEVVRDENGTVVGLRGTVQDITARKHAEDEARHARSQLESMLVAGEVGTWEFDVPGNVVHADRNLARMFDVTEADADGGPLEAYTRAIHPDDRERVADIIRGAWNRGTGTRPATDWSERTETCGMSSPGGRWCETTRGGRCDCREW